MGDKEYELTYNEKYGTLDLSVRDTKDEKKTEYVSVDLLSLRRQIPALRKIRVLLADLIQEITRHLTELEKKEES